MFSVSQEAHWLRKDTLLYGYMANARTAPAGFTLIETRAARDYSRGLVRVLKSE